MGTTGRVTTSPDNPQKRLDFEHGYLTGHYRDMSQSIGAPDVCTRADCQQSLLVRLRRSSILPGTCPGYRTFLCSSFPSLTEARMPAAFEDLCGECFA